jgi:D-glycero-D-manno-heptose 1,7-bisphosphate phosphatase
MGINKIMERGIFLDRDGVINPNIFYPDTGEWESPRSPADFDIFPWAIQSLRQLMNNQFKLFLVSNQPSYAKGKTTMDNLLAVQKKLFHVLTANGIKFSDYYYCYHHPRSVVPELAISCECRKPGTLFLKEAKRTYALDMKSSWMIGDRDTDVICGRKAGAKTILIINQKEIEAKKAGLSHPDFQVANLWEAVNLVLPGK